jgi:hypothetical protein
MFILGVSVSLLFNEIQIYTHNVNDTTNDDAHQYSSNKHVCDFNLAQVLNPKLMPIILHRTKLELNRNARTTSVTSPRVTIVSRSTIYQSWIVRWKLLVVNHLPGSLVPHETQEASRNRQMLLSTTIPRYCRLPKHLVDVQILRQKNLKGTVSTQHLLPSA